MFEDRFEAGEKLVPLLKKYKNNRNKPIVLAIPRGGVLTAFPIAKQLNAKLSLVLVRKLGVPNNEEQGFGAVDSDGQVTLNNDIVYYFGVSDEHIKQISEREKKVIEARVKIYNVKMQDLTNKTAIIVDDGLATGYTLLSAINFVKRKEAKKIIVAVPTAHASAYEMIKRVVDEIYCLDIARTDSYAVGMYYKNFHEVDHEEIKTLLAKLK